MYRMYRDVALNRLVDLMHEHRDKPASTVVEIWQGELLAYEDQRLEAHRAALEAKPPRYGLTYGERFVYTDAGGVDVGEYRPVRAVYFTEDKIPEVAKKNGLSVKKIDQLIRGEIFEHEGWRGLHERGLSNGAFIPRNTERAAMHEQIKREDVEIQRHVAKHKPYKAAQPPKVEVYE